VTASATGTSGARQTLENTFSVAAGIDIALGATSGDRLRAIAAVQGVL
jgi:hypothetical protein